MDEEEKDEVWVQRVQAGEVEAFETLILRHEKTVFNLLYRYLGSYYEATDVAQEVFIAAFRAIGKFRGESLFSTWLFRIAVNRAKNRMDRIVKTRKHLLTQSQGDGEAGKADSDLTAGLPDPGDGPEKILAKKEMNDLVHEGLKQLKQDERLLILLHDLQGLAYDEIAQMLELPLGTVKSRLHRARLALKKWLRPHVSEKTPL